MAPPFPPRELIDARRVSRHGFTLVELLVAISILVILMAVGVRMMNFSVEDRRTREAARAINVYVSSARNRAIETGRPCGVMLRRLPGQPLCVVGLDQVEVPPAYAGETLDSIAKLQVAGTSGGLATVTAQLTPGINVALVSKGDLVQFNCQGPLYTITAHTGNSLTLQITLLPGQMLPWPRAPELSPAMPYQIFRRPTKSAAAGLQLPVRAVIDLEFSGTDEDSIGGETDVPVWIMFSHNGSLDRIYYHCEHPGHETRHMELGTEPIYLLVGKQERVPVEDQNGNGTLDAGEDLNGNGVLDPPPAEDGLANWQDVKNFWVTLNPQTGLVTTTEVAKGANLAESRWNAREGQSMGGR